MSQENMNPFASQVLIITIGQDNIPSNIHEALLSQKTSFFEIHQTPNGGPREVNAQLERLNPEVKSEREGTLPPENPNELNGNPADGQNPAPRPSPNRGASRMIMSDYHLDIQHVKAFEVFVNWLYNKAPTVPKSQAQAKTLIQAYLIALKYQAYPLQDLIVDCLRRHFAENTFSFDQLFIYLLNRHGDDPHCKLIRYFVDQIAYEIYSRGYQPFKTEGGNLGIDTFLKDRVGGVVRQALFIALAKLAHQAKEQKRIVDPAVSMTHDYYATVLL